MEIYKHKSKDEYGIEEIYEYTTENLIMDEPCYVETIGNIYPIKVQEWTKFQKYIPYLINSKKHLKLKDDGNLLDTLIWLSATTKNGGKPIDFDNDSWVIYFGKAIKDFEDLFSMITRKRIRRFDLGGSFIFTDDIGECMINETNFEELRQVVQKMNLLKESIIYDDPLMEKWAKKWQIAHSKGKSDLVLSDIITIVSCEAHKSYEQLKNQNMFQLFSDFNRVSHAENYRNLTLFKTVSDKVPNTEFAKSISEELYKDRSKEMFISVDSIANKL